MISLFSAAILVSFSVHVSAPTTPHSIIAFQESQDFQKEQNYANYLYNLGESQYAAKKFEAALHSLQQALELYQKQSNSHAQGATLSMIAAVQMELGNYSDAILMSIPALQLAEQVQDIGLQARVLGNLGTSYESLGRYIEAVEAYEQALAKVALLSDSQGIWQKSRLLELLGNAYNSFGEYRQAIANYKESLAIAEAIGDVETEMTLYGNLGVAYSQTGQYSLALSNYEESLHLAQDCNCLREIAYALNNIGTIYQVQGQTQKSLESYQQSLVIARAENRLSLEVDILNNLGSLYEEFKDYEQAIAHYEQSLTKAKTTQSPQLVAISLNNLGHGLFNVGRLDEAEEKLRESIDNLESLRPTLNDTYNVSLFDTQVFTYSLLQQVLVAQNKPEAALEIAERGRAQAFIDLLAQRANPQRIENIAELQRSPISIEEIKAIAQQQNATLVEYALVPDDDFKFQGRQRGAAAEIMIWVVTPNGEVTLIHKDLADLLPEGTSFEELIIATRESVVGKTSKRRSASQDCLERVNLCIGNRVVRNDDDKEQYEIIDIDPQNQTVTLSHPGFTLPQPVFSATDVSKLDNPETKHNRLNELHQVLIDPIKELLPEDPEDRVIFVPQEQLFSVPFPALLDSSGDYLIESHTISTIPSIQVLETTRQRRLEIGDREGEALIVGNPSPMPTLPDDSEPLAALTNAETEANDIAKLLNTNALVKTAATETAIKQRISDAKLIHLATHGLFQEEGDPLQSSIALAPNLEDPDGFLTAEEILDFSLQADLVVLSACDTGRGSITGDGVIGLSRSFIAAGTPSIIVSLWQVPDQSTSQLMVKFYENRQTLDKAQSLRQAMLYMIDTGKNIEPKDWAAFTLIGEAE